MNEEELKELQNKVTRLEKEKAELQERVDGLEKSKEPEERVTLLGGCEYDY